MYGTQAVKQLENKVGYWMWFIEEVKKLTSDPLDYKRLMKLYNKGFTPEKAVAYKGEV
jgi:hypothetical protein